MRKETEKTIEKTKVGKGKSVLLSSISRKNNKTGRVKSKRLRNGKQFAQGTTIELFLRTNNLKDLPFRIECEKVNEHAVDIIKDIYPIIRDDISIFMSPNFTEETEPIYFLAWMMECYTDLNSEWEIIEDENRFSLIRLIDYDIEPVGYSLEIKFLEEVPDKILHNLLITSLSLMKRAGIPFWDCSSDIEMAEQMIDDDLMELQDLPKKERDKEHLQYLLDGKSELKVMELLSHELNANKLTIEEFVVAKNNFIKDNEVHEDIVNFFNYLEEFLKIKDNVFNYTHYYSSEVEEGNPIMPYEYAQIAYSLSESSAVGYRLNEFSTMNYNEYGALPFRVKEVNEVESVVSDYPYKYIQLLNLALEVERHYS